MTAHVQIPVSVAEVWDKITILKIKLSRCAPHQMQNIQTELTLLQDICGDITPQLTPWVDDLAQVNLGIWHAEDLIRKLDSQGVFDQEFINLARTIHTLNDQRAQIKKHINQLTQSVIQEEKVY